MLLWPAPHTGGARAQDSRLERALGQRPLPPSASSQGLCRRKPGLGEGGLPGRGSPQPWPLPGQQLPAVRRGGPCPGLLVSHFWLVGRAQDSVSHPPPPALPSNAAGGQMAPPAHLPCGEELQNGCPHPGAQGWAAAGRDGFPPAPEPLPAATVFGERKAWGGGEGRALLSL